VIGFTDAALTFSSGEYFIRNKSKNEISIQLVVQNSIDTSLSPELIRPEWAFSLARIPLGLYRSPFKSIRDSWFTRKIPLLTYVFMSGPLRNDDASLTLSTARDTVHGSHQCLYPRNPIWKYWLQRCFKMHRLSPCCWNGEDGRLCRPWG